MNQKAFYILAFIRSGKISTKWTSPRVDVTDIKTSVFFMSLHVRNGHLQDNNNYIHYISSDNKICLIDKTITVLKISFGNGPMTDK